MNKEKRIERAVKKLISEDSETVIQTVLENLLWPKEVKPGIEYFVNEDDTDGARRGMGVYFLDNGDGVIDMQCCVESHFKNSDIWTTPHVYRFRNSFGGGRKILVHSALLILAQAISMDPDEKINR